MRGCGLLDAPRLPMSASALGPNILSLSIGSLHKLIERAPFRHLPGL